MRFNTQIIRYDPPASRAEVSHPKSEHQRRVRTGVPHMQAAIRASGAMIRFGRDVLFSDRHARHLCKRRHFLDPLESRVLLAGIPASQFAAALDARINTLVNNIGAMGANTVVPGIGESVGQVCGVTNVFSGFRSNLAGALASPTSGDGKEELRSALFAELATYLADRNG